MVKARLPYGDLIRTYTRRPVLQESEGWQRRNLCLDYAPGWELWLGAVGAERIRMTGRVAWWATGPCS
jgi:hypothetical protein